MFDFLAHLFDPSGFPPRWTCGHWTDAHGWLHILSDLGIWLAYLAIPFLLGFFVLRRQDIPFRVIFLLFGAFILACGTTHLIDAILFWWPIYRFSGVVKLFTAVVSWGTVLALVPVVPKALALCSPEELEREIAARKQAEDKLQQTNAALEQRVAERTRELTQTVAALQAERELLRTTLGSIGDGVIATDTEGQVTFLNPVAEKLTGWATAEAKGAPLQQVFHIVNEKTRQTVENPALRALEKGIVVGLANHTILIAKDGTERPIDDSAAPIRDGGGAAAGSVLVFRDITERKRQESAQAERNRLIALRADVSTALASTQPTPTALQQCCEALVQHLAVAFARIWTLNESDNVLELEASAGLYTHLNGPHSHVPVGQFKIGRIAASGQPHLTNAVPDDPNVSDRAWAAREGMIAFAGYPLIVEGRVVGVVAMFARQRLSEGVLTELAPLSKGIAQYIDRKRAEEQLREQAELHRTTLTSIGDAVITTDTEGRITNLNAVAESLTGWTNDAALGQQLETVFRIVNEQTRQPVETPATRALKEGVIVGLANHTVLLARDGTERPIDDSAAPIRRGAGEVVGCVLVFRDVTSRRQHERELESREQQFRTLAESIPQLAWMANADGHLFWYNRRWYEYTGTTFEQMEGWGWQSVHDPAVLPKVMEKWQATLASGEPFDMVFPLKGKDGVFRPFLTRVMPVRNDEGQVIRWFGTNTDISEAKNAEERLREERERLDFALAAADLGQWELNLTDGKAQRTLRHDQIFGYNEVLPNWNYKVFLEHVLPSDRPAVDARFQEAVATGNALNIECRIRRADGAERWIWSKARTRQDAQGRVERMLGVLGDITEQKRQEDRLRESEGRLAALVEAVPLVVWTANNAGEIDFANRRWYDYTGLTPAQTMGTGWVVAVHPDDRKPTIAQWQVSLEKSEPIEVEYRLQRASDGSYRWQWARGIPLKDDNGQVIKWFGTVTDIHDRKQADEDRQKFVSLAENSTDFIGMCDLQYVPFYINRAGLDMVGLENLEQARSIPIQDWFFQEDQPWMGNEFFPSVLERGHGEVEIRFRHFKTQVPLWMLYKLFTLSDPQGRRIGLATVSRDITQRRQLEDNLRQLAADLSEDDRRKDEFLATLAHELRNPLAPIRNGLQVLRLADNNGQAIEHVRTMMERQLSQMVRLVDDLLDVSRITRNKLELRKERVELAAVVSSAIETSRPLIEADEHELTVTLPPTPIYLEADLTRLAQVYSNLLNNAAKYTERGGHIWLTAERIGNEVMVAVKDNGIGIRPDMLSKVFEMFIQADRALERAQGGLGIGLTLVQRLVQMHGGTVTAHSEGQGKGSEFVVRLPVLEESLGREEAAVPEEMAPSAIPKRRILVVDDNRDSANSLGMLLSMMGHDLRTAYDGLEGVETAAAFRPELILLDIGLPTLNGYEACRRIREQPWGQGIFLVACTGWGQEEDIRRSNEAGFDQHMVKPVDLEALMKLLAGLPPPPA